MSSPRYVVRSVTVYPSFSKRYTVYDTIKERTLTGHSQSKRTMEKRCDRYNASIIQQADAYRKAKYNG